MCVCKEHDDGRVEFLGFLEIFSQPFPCNPFFQYLSIHFLKKDSRLFEFASNFQPFHCSLIWLIPPSLSLLISFITVIIRILLWDLRFPSLDSKYTVWPKYFACISMGESQDFWTTLYRDKPFPKMIFSAPFFKSASSFFL